MLIKASQSECIKSVLVLTRNQPIYQPIFEFYQYIGIGQSSQFYQPQ